MRKRTAGDAHALKEIKEIMAQVRGLEEEYIVLQKEAAWKAQEQQARRLYNSLHRDEAVDTSRGFCPGRQISRRRLKCLRASLGQNSHHRMCLRT